MKKFTHLNALKGLCLRAFSLVELMISLITISVIVAAMTPVITKKLTSQRVAVGSFGGGANMQNMIRQAQKMQQEMERKNQELAETELVGASGGGMVEVVITGKNEIKAVRIKKEAVDPDDVEMLEDLIMAAIKDAQTKATNLSKEALGPMGGF